MCVVWVIQLPICPNSGQLDNRQLAVNAELARLMELTHEPQTKGRYISTDVATNKQTTRLFVFCYICACIFSSVSGSCASSIIINLVGLDNRQLSMNAELFP